MGQLKRVKRSGWWIAGVKDPESVAEHAFRTAVIAYLLAYLEGVDTGKAVLMALFHDMPETRTNDAHRIVRRYAKWEDVDRKAVDEQSKRLPNEMATQMATLFEELKKRFLLKPKWFVMQTFWNVSFRHANTRHWDIVMWWIGSSMPRESSGQTRLSELLRNALRLSLKNGGKV